MLEHEYSPQNEPSAGKTALRAALLTAVIVTLAALAAAAVAADAAAPLPPPPELLSDIDYGPADPVPAEDLPDEMRAPAASAEDLRRALSPLSVAPAAPMSSITQYVEPPAIWPATPSSVPVDATLQVAAAPARQPFTISPPSRFMPADYFNLPMIDEGIPGVLMPELDENFFDPGLAQVAGGAAVDSPDGRSRRPIERGMSVRQLEPFFALAKGSEGAALEAAGGGDDSTHRDQLGKAIDAYMGIISMADAGNEAREEAWYGVARCEYRLGNWWRSFEALERSFPKEFERSEIEGRIKLEIYIGERLWRLAAGSVPDTLVDGWPLTGYQAASRVYAAAVFNRPTDDDAPLALLRRGDAAAIENNWADAAKFYRQVIEYFPESEQAMQARSSLTEAVYRQEWPTGLPEAARTDVASVMDDVERAGPRRLSDAALERRSRAVGLANDLEAENRLRQAKAYLTRMRLAKSRDAAVFLLGDIVSKYPTTPQAAEAEEILAGLGIAPPERLTDGSRFPLTAGWSGADEGADAGALAAGMVRLETAGGMEVAGGAIETTDAAAATASAMTETAAAEIDAVPLPSELPFSPTRETVYAVPELPAVPGIVSGL